MARAMKDSGIEWLGDIPADWDVAKVKYFFDIQLGKMLQPEPNDKDDTLEYYLCAANLGGNNLKMDSLKQMWLSPTDKAKFDVRKGDLLVVEGGDVASCDVFNEDVQNLYIQNALHRVRSKNGCDVRFLRYILIIAKARGYIDLICNKSTLAHFTKDKFASMPCIVTPLDEQQRIADFLDKKCARIDSVIENTRASIEEYKKLKQSLITRAVTKGIRPNRPTKDSGIEWLGDIPADWEIHQLKNNFRIYSGATPKSEIAENWDGNIVWITPADYKTADKYVSQGKRNISEIGYTSCGTTLVPSGSIVFSKRAPIGTVAITKTELCTNQGCLSCVPNENACSEFFYYVMSVFTEQFNLFGSGTTFKEISYDAFRSFRVPLPPLAEQREIAAYLDEKTAAIDSLIAKKNRLVSELESLKKSLIFEYVTGKKEVPT